MKFIYNLIIIIIIKIIINNNNLGIPIRDSLSFSALDRLLNVAAKARYSSFERILTAINKVLKPILENSESFSSQNF
jgi:protein gp37